MGSRTDLFVIFFSIFHFGNELSQIFTHKKQWKTVRLGSFERKDQDAHSAQRTDTEQCLKQLICQLTPVCKEFSLTTNTR